MARANVVAPLVAIGIGLLAGEFANADATAVPAHPHFQFVRNMDCKNNQFTAADQMDNCIGGKRLPYAFDAESALADGTIFQELGASGAELVQNAGGFVVGIIHKFSGGSSPAATETDQAGLQPASKKEVAAAAAALQAKGVICPTGPYDNDTYKLMINPPKGQAQDPNAYLCLDTSKSGATVAYGRNLVSASVIINPAYKGIAYSRLAESFKSLDGAACREKTKQLRALGSAAARDTGKIPADHEAAVDLSVQGTNDSSGTYTLLCPVKPAANASSQPSQGAK